MNYNEAISYIENKTKLGIKPGLSSIRDLLAALGNPQRKLKAVHIAGTNGKGSAGAFLESILIQAGMKVGRYTSPAVFEYLERFTLSGVKVSEEDFAEAIGRIAGLPEAEHATVFETETAAAFYLFALKNVEIALIECGMGGLNDATNVDFDTRVCMITSIGPDHISYLGPTMKDIAVNKAGIIKPDSVTVTAPQTDEVLEVIKRRCIEAGSELVAVPASEIRLIRSDIEGGTAFSYKGEEYRIKLPGTYQPENAACAIEVALALGNLGFKVSKEDIRIGLGKAYWPGRMDVVSREPLVIFDGAHNEPAWKKLVESVDFYFTNRRIIYIIGVFKDKDYDKLVRLVSGMDNTRFVICITAPGERGLDRDILSDCFEKAGVRTMPADGFRDALKLAERMAEPDDVTVCCGSLSYFKEAEETYGTSKQADK